MSLIVDETGTTLDYCINKVEIDNNMNTFSIFVLNHKDKIKETQLNY